MKHISKDFCILLIGQILTSSVTSLLTSVSSLSGAYLAPMKVLSTVPVMATTIGGLLMVFPASYIMGRFGRRTGFLLKAMIGIISSIVCFSGLLLHSFYLFVFGTFLVGLFSAFGQYYRFAVIDTVNTEKERITAVSVISGVGIFGAFAGPMFGSEFSNFISTIPYGGSFLFLGVLCIGISISQSFLSSNLGIVREKKLSSPKDNINQMISNKAKLNADFVKISIIGSISVAIMTFVMNAAPLSIAHDGYKMSSSALAMQIHFVMMSLPSFFIPAILKKISKNKLVLLSGFLGAFECVLAIFFKQTLILYCIELGILGASWCFMTNVATMMLVNTYTEKNKVKAQGCNLLIIAFCGALASLSSGIVMALSGWILLNLLCIPLLLISVILVLSYNNKNNVEVKLTEK
jgi:MFS family permease